MVDGMKQMIPTALVGEWSSSDLPKRRADGSIYFSYHVKHIAESTPFRPNASNMFEHNPGKVDPRSLPAIDLSVPEMTQEALGTAALFQCKAKIEEILQHVTRENIQQKLDDVRTLLIREAL